MSKAREIAAPAPVKSQRGSLVAALAELNRLVHEPARLAILSVLANCNSADFSFLEKATGLSRGNLWVQLTRLEEASLIGVEKTQKRNRPITTVKILPEGRSQLQRYWWRMEEIADLSRRP